MEVKPHNFEVASCKEVLEVSMAMNVIESAVHKKIDAHYRFTASFIDRASQPFLLPHYSVEYSVHWGDDGCAVAEDLKIVVVRRWDCTKNDTNKIQ